MHDAIKKLRVLSERCGIGMDELGLRWVVHRSILRDGDAVILGARQVEHLERNVAQIQKGALSEDVVWELQTLSEKTREESKSTVEYFQSKENLKEVMVRQ